MEGILKTVPKLRNLRHTTYYEKVGDSNPLRGIKYRFWNGKDTEERFDSFMENGRAAISVALRSGVGIRPSLGWWQKNVQGNAAYWTSYWIGGLQTGPVKYVSIFAGNMAGVLTSPSGIGLLVEGRYFAKNAPADKKRVSRLLSPLFNVGVMFAVSVVETWQSVKDNGYAPNLRAIDVVESSAAHVVADVTAVAVAEGVIGLGEMGWDNEWVGRGYRSVAGAWTAWRERVAAKKKENIPLDQPELSLEEEIAAVRAIQKEAVENIATIQLEQRKKKIDSLWLSRKDKKEMKNKVSEAVNAAKEEIVAGIDGFVENDTKEWASSVTREYLERVKSKMKEMSPAMVTELDDTRVSEQSHLPSLDTIAENAMLAVDRMDASFIVFQDWEREKADAKKYIAEMKAKLPKSVLILAERVMQKRKEAAMKLVRSNLMPDPDANMSPVTKAAVNTIIDSFLPTKMSSWLNNLHITWNTVGEKIDEALIGG
jgi:hypothetical protein